MDNRLYIIEGLPCSGKSTFSKYIADILSENHKVSYTDEGSGDHPADYEFHSFLKENELSSFSADEQKKIKSCSEKISDGYIIPLADLSGEIFDRLIQHKIYDFLPWETEKQHMLRKWKCFRDSADKETIYVFNCVLLQNPMCETMMRFGFSADISFGYISEITDIIKPMKPYVIYLKNTDISSSVKKAAAERNGWLDAVTDYHVNGEYGKSIAASGFEGYISCLEERQRRELDILSRLGIEYTVIDEPQRDYAAACEKIKEILK